MKGLRVFYALNTNMVIAAGNSADRDGIRNLIFKLLMPATLEKEAV